MKKMIWILVSFFTLGYLIPTAVAACRNLRNQDLIFIVNLFLGWTLVGWVMALAWAVSDTAAKRT